MRSVFYLTLSAIATLAAAATSGANPFNIPSEGYSFEAGQPTTLSWDPTTSGTVSLKLQWGAVLTSNTDNIANSGSFTWTPPANLAAQPDYTIEILSDDDKSQVNYLPRFAVAGATATASTTAASTTSTAESTTSATKSSATETTATHSKSTATETNTTLTKATTSTASSSSATASGTSTDSISASSTSGTSTAAPSTTRASSTTSASASASTTSIVNVNAGMANRVSGGMLAIVLGAVAVL
ncbi:GPI anchored serine-threonine rich family protein [Aspergillus alliaceus]|uniref:GPI anchored serine-threonine rich family protein n=1 Tax=Petromyces alliaceus TaxID=209559 RepID=UPI0012A751EF|nr:Ser-Thr-rich glycosyl-phosphatidyl-inositol-anchored membrane family-domain-containing protein [Aspergillus alliaceus]KAB8230185.1 Ser-Thr-rich glycosyl-phosphatidyl-inositol-anchored membrane family-domain-containing protein [Aspergillus alliaceus]